MLRPVLVLPLLTVLCCGLRAQAPAETPPASSLSALLPASPLKTRMLQFVATLDAKTDAKAPADAPKAATPHAELTFEPRERWFLLGRLAEQLAGGDEAQKQAVQQLLEQGATEMRKALATQHAENDVGAAATLFVTQLWQCARGAELSEAQVDALHGKLAAHLATPEVGVMRDASKQRVWEYCIGYAVFVGAMRQQLEKEEEKAGLRQLASLAFESLTGVAADKVELGDRAPAAAGDPPPAGTGPSIPDVTYTAPEGWTREKVGPSVVFRSTLYNVDDQGKPLPDNEARNQATIGVLPVLTAANGATKLFEQTWNQQFAPFELGDTVVHYRSRLQSKLVVLFMGRFFQRPNTPATMGNPRTYGALYLVDLGGDRYQPIVALVEPHDPGIGMDGFKETRALQAFAYPLGAFLDSIKPEKGDPPQPAGGYFAASDLHGLWTESSSAYGGEYYNTNTGSFAGVAVHSSGGHFYLRDDGTYDYAFAFASYNPQFGNSMGSTKHNGTYKLDGDIVLIEPQKPIPYKFTCCAVGVGTRKTDKGVRRILVTVSANIEGKYFAPHLIANWDSYAGTMTWYQEDPDAK